LIPAAVQGEIRATAFGEMADKIQEAVEQNKVRISLQHGIGKLKPLVLYLPSLVSLSHYGFFMHQVYRFEKGEIKPANQRFNSTKHQYEITFNRNTVIEEVCFAHWCCLYHDIV
jgi:hypothetical protein